MAQAEMKEVRLGNSLDPHEPIVKMVYSSDKTSESTMGIKCMLHTAVIFVHPYHYVHVKGSVRQVYPMKLV